MNRGEGKSFGRVANERIREGLKELLRQHGDNQTRLAEKLGISQPAVSAIRSGKSNAGPVVAQAIARELGTTLEQLTSGTKSDEEFVRWRVLGWWDDLLQAARDHSPTISEEAWEWLGSLAGPPPPEDPAALGMIARAWDDAQARLKMAKKATPKKHATSPSADATSEKPTTPKKPRAA